MLALPMFIPECESRSGKGLAHCVMLVYSMDVMGLLPSSPVGFHTMLYSSLITALLSTTVQANSLHVRTQSTYDESRYRYLYTVHYSTSLLAIWQSVQCMSALWDIFLLFILSFQCSSHLKVLHWLDIL